MPLDLSGLADAAEDLASQVVDIEQLTTPRTGTRGAPEDNYDTELTDVPCLILPRRASEMERAQQPQETKFFKVLFFAEITLGSDRRIKYGSRYLYPGETRNVAESDAMWVCEAQEYP